MEAIIAKKMAEGITFFIIEPRFGGLAAPRRTKLENVADARDHRALAIKDEDFARFVGEAETATVTKTPPASVKTVRRARTAKEAASTETVGVRQMRGG
jgi:hypothetical protein